MDELLARTGQTEPTYYEKSALLSNLETVTDMCSAAFRDSQGSLPDGCSIDSCFVKAGAYNEPFVLTVEPIGHNLFQKSYNLTLSGTGIPKEILLLVSEEKLHPDQQSSITTTIYDTKLEDYRDVWQEEMDLITTAVSAAIDTAVAPKTLGITFKRTLYEAPQRITPAVARGIGCASVSRELT